jgi:hypothetical protein
MRSKVTMESVTCDLELRDRKGKNSCANVSKKICEATGTSLYTPFDSRGPILSQSYKEHREFEESRVRLRLLNSSQSHRLQASPPPPLQTSKQRATSPHVGMGTKKKAQAESA